MTSRVRFKTMFLVAAMLAASAACKKNSPSDEMDRAAEKTTEGTQKMKDLSDQAKDQAKETSDQAKDQAKEMSDQAKDQAKEMSDEAKEMGKDMSGETKDVQTAESGFEQARTKQIETLRGIHGVITSEAMLISSLSSSLPIAETERSKIDEKLQILRTRLDESANQIQSLGSAEAETWDQQASTVLQAMNSLEDARKDAWQTLHEAEQPDQTSMR